MGMPRPSLTLIMDIDESLKTEELRLEVNRCYSYVAPTVIHTHPSEEEPVNVLHFLVKMGNHKYLDSAEAGAEELWNEVVEKWLSNTFFKVGNNLKLFNRRQREVGNPELFFETMDVELENGALVVSYHLDSNSSINAEDSAMIGKLRAAMNAGTLAGAVRVVMPDPASYAAQFDAGVEAKAAAEEAKLAEAEAARQAAEEQAAAAAHAAEDAFMESPELTASEEEAQAEALQESIEEKYSFADPLFVIDYASWEVHFADGSTKVFDSAANEFRA